MTAPPVRWSVAFVVWSLLAACAAPAESGVRFTETTDPGVVLRELTRQLDPDDPYRDPTGSETESARAVARAMLTAPGNAPAVAAGLTSLGFQTHSGMDPVTGRPYLLAVADSTNGLSWGGVLLDTSTTPSVVLEVPHPGFDMSTDVLGVELFRARPGAVLIVAGAHRLAGGGAADVAHNDHSFFHVVATELASGGLAEIQLHGFADESIPGIDVAVSTGSGPTTVQAKRVAAELARSFRVCVAWRSDCGQLEGITNVQGRRAAEAGTVFLHLEISWTVRREPRRRAELVESMIMAIAPT